MSVASLLIADLCWWFFAGADILERHLCATDDLLAGSSVVPSTPGEQQKWRSYLPLPAKISLSWQCLV
jgi:hypothetical protein